MTFSFHELDGLEGETGGGYNIWQLVFLSLAEVLTMQADYS